MWGGGGDKKQVEANVGRREGLSDQDKEARGVTRRALRPGFTALDLGHLPLFSTSSHYPLFKSVTFNLEQSCPLWVHLAKSEALLVVMMGEGMLLASSWWGTGRTLNSL